MVDLTIALSSSCYRSFLFFCSVKIISNSCLSLRSRKFVFLPRYVVVCFVSKIIRSVFTERERERERERKRMCNSFVLLVSLFCFLSPFFQMWIHSWFKVYWRVWSISLVGFFFSCLCVKRWKSKELACWSWSRKHIAKSGKGKINVVSFLEKRNEWTCILGKKER